MTPNFANLNFQTLAQILRHLPMEDKKTARLVSRRWNAVLDNLLRYSIPLTNTTLPDLESRTYRMNELKVALNQLNIPTRYSQTLPQTFQTAKTLHIMTDANQFITSQGIIDGKGVELLLKTCSQIQTLRFDFNFLGYEYTMTSVLNVSKVKLRFLTKLQVDMTMTSFIIF